MHDAEPRPVHCLVPGFLGQLESFFSTVVVGTLSKIIFFDVAFWTDSADVPLVVLWLIIGAVYCTVRFSFEVRSQNRETLEAFYDLFLSECGLVGEERGVEFRVDRRLESAPAVMDADWIARLKAAARALGLPDEDIPSGAGHDAAVFANAGIPSAMIFVRNQNGSHNPHEAMAIGDFLAGIAVMRDAIREALR